ncbi:MAG: hypothetical protein AAFO75_01230, partial [Pseudomonadota bacterium]
ALGVMKVRDPGETTGSRVISERPNMRLVNACGQYDSREMATHQPPMRVGQADGKPDEIMTQ